MVTQSGRERPLPENQHPPSSGKRKRELAHWTGGEPGASGERQSKLLPSSWANGPLLPKVGQCQRSLGIGGKNGWTIHFPSDENRDHWGTRRSSSKGNGGQWAIDSVSQPVPSTGSDWECCLNLLLVNPLSNKRSCIQIFLSL